MFAILGSGFGIYGYLPALVDGCAQQIVLPERYRTRFLERPKLARYAGNVHWKVNEEMTLDCAEGVVVARRPMDQFDCIHDCLARPNIQRFLLEKPLAHSPENAMAVFDDLIRARKSFRIGYLFPYTTWGQKMLNALRVTRERGVMSIRWCFLAHHFQNDLQNWKRFSASGGGVIRFYGIQIIALLAAIGYQDVILSQTFGTSADEAEKWTAVFAGGNLPECEVVVDTNSTVPQFHAALTLDSIHGQVTSTFASASDPFDLARELFRSDGNDKRVPILIELCRSLWVIETGEYEWYAATNVLWRSIEDKTQFETLHPSHRPFTGMH